MNTAISEEQKTLYDQLDQVQEQIAALEQDLRVVDGELESLAGERERYRLLNEACSSLERLKELDADTLFWGEELRGHDTEEHIGRVRRVVTEFEENISAIDKRRERLTTELEKQRGEVEYLRDEIRDIQAREERRKEEFVVEREISPVPHRTVIMPWTKSGEDEKRYRKALLIALLVSITLGYVVPLWKLPPPEKRKAVEVPERLAKLVKERKKPKPKPKPPKPEKEEPKKKEQTKEPSKHTPKPTTAQAKAARKKAEGSGLLAFSDSFSDLVDNAPEAKLGAKARVSNHGRKTGRTERSIVATEAAGSSGGIAASAVSRDVGGGGGKQITGVKFSRVTSSIAAATAAKARPESKGPGASRGDEDIQIVFDRYKATLYRIYNRELRKNPTLQGKMVLRITIAPDGRVTACSVQSTDLASPELSAKIVARVKQFNFGPKKGVPSVTILYPIDFLPAS